MSFIECYEPELCAILWHATPIRLYTSARCGKRDSPEPDADRARKLRSGAHDACAFDLQLTYRPVEENAADSPRAMR